MIISAQLYDIDWDQYLKIYNDPLNRKYRFLAEDSTLDELKNVYTEQRDKRDLYGIWDENSTFYGVVEIKNLSRNKLWALANLFVIVDSAMHGKGIATKALKQVLDDWEWPPIMCFTWKDNVGMQRVAEKCGFEILGNIQYDLTWRHQEKEVPAVVYIWTEGMR